jgi:hypothetical protein
MTRRRHRHDIPRYVDDLIDAAGRDGVYWWSGKSPGRRPSLGGPIDRLDNRVPQSPTTATQSTPSSQPSWQGDGVKFAGDDLLENDSADPGAAPNWVAFFVWDRVASADTNSLGGWEDTGDNTPSVWLLSNSSNLIRTKTVGEFDNTANPTIYTGIDLSSRSVTAHRIDWSAGVAEVWCEDGDGLHHAAETASLNRATCPTGRLGARGDDAFPLEGHIYEAATAQGDLLQADIEAIIARLADKWRV